MSASPPINTSAAATDVGEFITDLDGGSFDRKLSIALSQVAAAAIDHDKTGKVSIEFTFEKIPGTVQARCTHLLKFIWGRWRGASAAKT